MVLVFGSRTQHIHLDVFIFLLVSVYTAWLVPMYTAWLVPVYTPWLVSVYTAFVRLGKSRLGQDIIVLTNVVIELRSILSSKLRHRTRVNEHARYVPKHGRYEHAGSCLDATKKKTRKRNW